MEKDLQTTLLFDSYGELLTDKQRQAMDLYYNQDLSLGEIAEPLGISRQGVRDFLVRGERQLASFEERLGLVARFRSLHGELEQLQDDVGKMIRTARQSRDVARLTEQLESVQVRLERIRTEL